jgi:hypothetical protein
MPPATRRARYGSLAVTALCRVDRDALPNLLKAVSAKSPRGNRQSPMAHPLAARGGPLPLQTEPQGVAKHTGPITQHAGCRSKIRAICAFVNWLIYGHESGFGFDQHPLCVVKR